MIGGVTYHMLLHLSGVPHLHVNRPLIIYSVSLSLWDMPVLFDHMHKYLNFLNKSLHASISALIS